MSDPSSSPVLLVVSPSAMSSSAPTKRAAAGSSLGSHSLPGVSRPPPIEQISSGSLPPRSGLSPPVIPVCRPRPLQTVRPVSAEPNNYPVGAPDFPPISPVTNNGADSTTKRKRRTAEDAAEERNKREARRIAKEKEKKEKEDDTRRKQAGRVVRMQLARQAKLEKTPCFTWTTATTEDLVQLVSQLKFEHDSVLEANPGFISWGIFFKENSYRKEAFDNLKDVPFEALDRRYEAICTTYKASL